MRRAWTITTLAAVAALLPAPSNAEQNVSTVAAQNEMSASLVKAVQSAQDPSAVVLAYANALAVDRKNPRLHEAYIRRMVDLGSPEMAYSQAQMLVALDANNGLAWGVIAYVAAKRGDAVPALSDIALAVQTLPDDPFIQRTTAQLIAWYDSRPRLEVADNIKLLVARLRARLVDQPAYAQAYKEAMAAYNDLAKKDQQTQTQQPAQTATTQQPTYTQQQPSYSTTNYYTTTDYPTYSTWGWGWGWPWWGGPFLFGNSPFFFPFRAANSSILLANGQTIPFRAGQTILFSGGQPSAVVDTNGRIFTTVSTAGSSGANINIVAGGTTIDPPRAGANVGRGSAILVGSRPLAASTSGGFVSGSSSGASGVMGGSAILVASHGAMSTGAPARASVGPSGGTGQSVDRSNTTFAEFSRTYSGGGGGSTRGRSSSGHAGASFGISHSGGGFGGGGWHGGGGFHSAGGGFHGGGGGHR